MILAKLWMILTKKEEIEKGTPRDKANCGTEISSNAYANLSLTGVH
jgi:hypothetical protein